jgi:hypothetical protein
MFHACLLCQTFYITSNSFSGSILTAGGIEGALVDGKIADVIGRRAVRFFWSPFSISLISHTTFHNEKALLLSQILMNVFLIL